MLAACSCRLEGVNAMVNASSIHAQEGDPAQSCLDSSVAACLQFGRKFKGLLASTAVLVHNMSVLACKKTEHASVVCSPKVIELLEGILCSGYVPAMKPAVWSVASLAALITSPDIEHFLTSDTIRLCWDAMERILDPLISVLSFPSSAVAFGASTCLVNLTSASAPPYIRRFISGKLAHLPLSILSRTPHKHLRVAAIASLCNLSEGLSMDVSRVTSTLVALIPAADSYRANDEQLAALGALHNYSNDSGSFNNLVEVLGIQEMYSLANGKATSTTELWLHY